MVLELEEVATGAPEPDVTVRPHHVLGRVDCAPHAEPREHYTAGIDQSGAPAAAQVVHTQQAAVSARQLGSRGSLPALAAEQEVQTRPGELALKERRLAVPRDPRVGQAVARARPC